MFSVPSGYPVPRAQWREKLDSCPNCGKRFTFFTAKSNCPCCGELFCSDCLQAEVTLGEGREPTAVCLSCFSMIQDHRREAAKHAEAVPRGSPTSSRLSATPRTPRREVGAEDSAVAAVAQHVKTLTAQSAALRAENELTLAKLADVQASLKEAKQAVLEKDTANAQLQGLVRELQHRVERRESGSDLTRPASSSSFSALPAQPHESQVNAEPQTATEKQLERKVALYERQIKDQSASLAEAAASHARDMDTLQQRQRELERQCSHLEGELKEAREQRQALKDVNMMLQEELHALTESGAAGAAAATELDTLRDQLATLTAERDAWRATETKLRSDNVRLAEREHEREASEARAVEEAHRAQSGAVDGVALLPETRWRQSSLVHPIVPEVRDTQAQMSPDRPQAAQFLEWGGFDVAAVSENVPCILAHVAREVADQWGLFDDNQGILRDRFIQMGAVLAANYRENAYHNAVHAADVLQGVSSLVTSCTPLFTCLTRLEKRAVAFAAMAHDVRHPGRSSPFLKQCFDPVYLTFNGLSPLEQMHTSTATELLSHEQTDFTADLTNAEALEFHALVSDLILHTDMTKHDSSLAAVGRRAWAEPFDYTKPEDRHCVLRLLLHAADIGAQAKGVPIALKWLGVVEEMRQQGDDEAARGLSVSPGCQRDSGPIEPGQLFFLTRFVFPVFDVVHQLFPDVSQPLANLRDLFAHYQRLTGSEASFPESITHRQEADEQLEALRAKLEAAEEAQRSQQEKQQVQQQYIDTLKDSAVSSDEARRMLQSQLQRLESQLAGSHAEITKLEAKLFAKAQEAAAAAAAAPSQETALPQSSEAVDDQVPQRVREDLEALQERVKALEEENASLTDSVAHAHEKDVATESTHQEAELAKLRDEADLWKQRAEAMKVRAAEAASTLTSFEETVASLKAANAGLEQEKAQLTADAETQAAKLQSLEAQLTAQVANVTQDRDQMAKTLSDRDTEREAEVAKLRDEADLWKQRAEAMKARAAEQLSSNAATVAEMEALRADLVRLEQENGVWSSHQLAEQIMLEKVGSQVADLTQMIQEERQLWHERMCGLMRDSTARRAEVNDLRAQLECAHAAAQEKERARVDSEKSLDKQLKSATDALSRLSSASSATEEALAVSQTRCAKLEEEAAELRAQVAKLQADLDAKDTHQHTTVAQLKEKAAQLQAASQDLKARESTAQAEAARLAALSETLHDAQQRLTRDEQAVHDTRERVKAASAVLAKERADLDSARRAWDKTQADANEKLAQQPPPLDPARVAELESREAATKQQTQNLVTREEALAAKLAALNEQITQLEARESRAAVLSDQLAIIAEKMNRQQRRLRLREARVNGLTGGAGQNTSLQSHRSASASTASPPRPEVDRDGSGPAHVDPAATTASLNAALRNIRDALARGSYPLVPLVVDQD